MADTALSALTATTTLASGDLIYVVDGGSSRKIDWDDVVAQLAAATKALTNTTIDANGTGNSVTNIETADLAAGSKSGADATVVTGTAGTDGNLVAWNADGDAVDSGSAVSDFATAAQGALADTATQPADITNMVESDPTGVTGADAITNIMSLTQAEYDAITPDAATLYVITDA